MERYGRRNNVEISGISNDASDENLAGKLTDIEGSHRLPPGRVNTSNNKRMIVKFVNRKHSEVLLRLKSQ